MKTTATLLLAALLSSCAATSRNAANAQAAFYRTEAQAINNPGNLGAQLNYGLMSYMTGAPMRGSFGTGYNPYLSNRQNSFLSPVTLR